MYAGKYAKKMLSSIELEEIVSCDFESADSTEEQEDTESPDMKDSLIEVERFLESNFVEGFAFQESDRAICHYRIPRKNSV